MNTTNVITGINSDFLILLGRRDSQVVYCLSTKEDKKVSQDSNNFYFLVVSGLNKLVMRLCQQYHNDIALCLQDVLRTMTLVLSKQFCVNEDTSLSLWGLLKLRCFKIHFFLITMYNYYKHSADELKTLGKFDIVSLQFYL